MKMESQMTKTPFKNAGTITENLEGTPPPQKH